MSDLLRKQILLARNKLTDPGARVDEKWLNELIGEKAVREIKAEAKRRVSEELMRRNLVVPPWPHEPRDDELGLSDEGMAYWSAVQKAKADEPEFKHYEPKGAAKRIRKVKLRMPRRIQFIAGRVLFSPKLNKRERFIADLRTVVDDFERLPESEKAKFTTKYAPEIGGMRFPYPVALARAADARKVCREAEGKARPVRAEVTRQTWVDGLDRALGRKSGFYKVEGRIAVTREGGDEHSH